MMLGAAVLYVPGLIWLSAWIGAAKAVEFGLLPFIAGDVVKAAVAALGFPAAWALLSRR
jgi:biotin transport system substrate-specific component